MIDLDELIAEARRQVAHIEDKSVRERLIDRLADALEAATGRFECDRECIKEGAPIEDCSAHGRTLAEAEALKRVNRMEIVDGKEAVGFRNGFIAGRTSVTREQIVDVLVMSPLSDYAGTEMGPINRTADAVLALLNGDTDD